MGIQAKKTVFGGKLTAKVNLCQKGLVQASEALARYYKALDLGTYELVKGFAAQEVYDYLKPIVEASAKRLVPRRTGLRGGASWHAVEDISQEVISALLTKVVAGSAKRRFDPSKRDLGAFIWVVVDRAIISGICRKKIPTCFSTFEIAESLVQCHRSPDLVEQLDSQKQKADLLQAFEILPEITRLVITRVFLEGEGKKKIAHSMGRTAPFVTREIAKGIMMLKAIYQHRAKAGSWPAQVPQKASAPRLDA